MPPNTTMTKIIPQQHNSQTATGRELAAAAAVLRAAGWVSAVGRDTLVPGEFLRRQRSK
jgi:hypothetical protein